jgi:hypothetical protein
MQKDCAEPKASAQFMACDAIKPVALLATA